MSKFYAGIGSRETPEAMCHFMTQLARRLAQEGYTLRSGGADGADTAFENGVPEGSPKEIYLPWRGFNGNGSPLYDYSNHEKKLHAIAAQHHPTWHSLPPAVRRLHARNVSQVLGVDGESLSAFVVCWTPQGKGTGGTGQAIRIARSRGIPIYDLGAFTPAFVMRALGL